MDPELAGQRGRRGGALLDIGAGARRRGGIGVQSELHHRALPEVGLHSGVMASPGRAAQWVFKGCGNLRCCPMPNRDHQERRRRASPVGAGRSTVSFRPAIPWRVAPQQSPLPLRRPRQSTSAVPCGTINSAVLIFFHHRRPSAVCATSTPLATAAPRRAKLPRQNTSPGRCPRSARARPISTANCAASFPTALRRSHPGRVRRRQRGRAGVFHLRPSASRRR